MSPTGRLSLQRDSFKPSVSIDSPADGDQSTAKAPSTTWETAQDLPDTESNAGLSPNGVTGLLMGDSRDPSGNFVTGTEERDLKRGLTERHIAMMGLAGAIGTGLFLGLGTSVANAGPLGALLGYTTIGLVVCAVQFALVVFIVIFMILITAISLSLVRILGEVEYIFAWLKICLIVFLIILGLVIALGGIPGAPPTYFDYWKDPGLFVEHLVEGNIGRFLGYWSVMNKAAFAFAGIQAIAMAGAEIRNPRQAIPAACKTVFFRVIFFYVLAVLVVGMLVRSSDKRLKKSSGTAAQSPFVLAASAAGLPAIPSVVNAVVITSAWSSANQSVLVFSRALYALALKRQMPRVFLRTTSWGIPYVCVGVCVCFMSLSFLSLSKGALTAFFWLLDISAAGLFFGWITILLNHIRMRRALDAQGIPRSRLPWSHSWTPYSSYAAVSMCILILFTSGFPVFIRGHWDPAKFITSYIIIPILVIAFFACKLLQGTKFVRLKDIDLHTALEEAEKEATERGPTEQRNKILAFCF